MQDPGWNDGGLPSDLSLERRFAPWRADLWSRVGRKRVLEVGVGTGKNLIEARASGGRDPEEEGRSDGRRFTATPAYTA
jgi:hypothetical protein